MSQIFMGLQQGISIRPNNPGKFPDGYFVELSKPEKMELVENFHRFEKLKHSTVNPKTFTEKGLYMLATILKSTKATQATISIAETFSKLRELSKSIKELSVIQDKAEQKSLMQKSGELITEILDDDLQTSDAETSIKRNFAVLKLKHTIKKTRQMMCHHYSSFGQAKDSNRRADAACVVGDSGHYNHGAPPADATHHGVGMLDLHLVPARLA